MVQCLLIGSCLRRRVYVTGRRASGGAIRFEARTAAVRYLEREPDGAPSWSPRTGCRDAPEESYDSQGCCGWPCLGVPLHVAMFVTEQSSSERGRGGRQTRIDIALRKGSRPDRRRGSVLACAGEDDLGARRVPVSYRAISAGGAALGRAPRSGAEDGEVDAARRGGPRFHPASHSAACHRASAFVEQDTDGPSRAS